MTRRWWTQVVGVLSSDGLVAALVAVAAFGVYLRTLLPDVGGPEDSPKFQYLGAVLGTAHAPGYPLHTLLSHVFSWLPIGTVAYRANLFSAVAAAGGVALVVLLARALGASRAASAVAGLATAYGVAYWRYAVLAEVYALHALLLVAVALWLVRWSQSRTRRDLFIAAGAFALALGNHVSIAAAVPAIAAFVLLTDARLALARRTLLPAMAIAASGFLLYGFILIRTWQGAPYLESQAGNLGELADLITARRYSDLVFAFDLSTLVTDRAEAFGRVIVDEFGWLGLTLAGLGVLELARRNWRAAAFLAAAISGIAALMLNVVGDVRGFLVAPMALAGVFVAVGADGIARGLAGRVPRNVVAGVVLALFVHPGWLVQRNFARNDWSQDGEAQFYRAVSGALPDQAVLVEEDYTTRSAIEYFQAAERTRRWRQLSDMPPSNTEAVRQAVEAGDAPVFAFDDGASLLRVRGFRTRSVPLVGPLIADLVADVPVGYHVVVATDSGVPPDLAPALRARAFPSGRRRFTVLAATVGDSEMKWDGNDRFATVSTLVPRRTHFFSPQGVAGLSAEAGPRGALIRLDDRVVAAESSGLVVAVFDQRGEYVSSFRGEAPDFHVLVEDRPFFRITAYAPEPSLAFGDGRWHVLTDLAQNGSIQLMVDNFDAFEAGVVLYASADVPLSPILNRWPDRRTRYRPSVQIQEFDTGGSDGLTALDDTLARDGVEPDAFRGRGRFVTRVASAINDRGYWAAWQLAFAGVPRHLIGRAETDFASPARAVASAVPPLTDDLQDGPLTFGLGRPSAWLLGGGWHVSDVDAEGEYRRTAASRAILLMPLEEGPLSIALVMRALSAADRDADEVAVALVVNGTDVGPCALSDTWQACAWTVPAGVVRTGLNEIALVSPESGPLDVAVWSARLERPGR